MNYYTTDNSNKGTLNLSSFVFSQIASETLENLAKDVLKDSISLKLVKSRKTVEAFIDKNKITVQITISAKRDSDVQKAVNLIQKEVYESIYEATEISDVKVNVSVISFVDNDK